MNLKKVFSKLTFMILTFSNLKPLQAQLYIDKWEYYILTNSCLVYPSHPQIWQKLKVSPKKASITFSTHLLKLKSHTTMSFTRFFTQIKEDSCLDSIISRQLHGIQIICSAINAAFSQNYVKIWVRRLSTPYQTELQLKSSEHLS